MKILGKGTGKDFIAGLPAGRGLIRPLVLGNHCGAMNRHPLQPITDEEVRAFEEDGLVVLRGLFDNDWVELLRSAAEDCPTHDAGLEEELAMTGEDAGRAVREAFIWRANENCRRFVFGSPAAEIAATLMRAEKVSIFRDQWLGDDAGRSSRVSWYHDLPDWPVDGWQICSLWLALDPVTADNGAVEYIKGSHRWGQRIESQHPGGDQGQKENLRAKLDVEAHRDDLEIVQFELMPGDCTVHHALLVHGEPDFLPSGRQRQAIITGWVGEDVVYRPGGERRGAPKPPLGPGDPPDGAVWPQVWPEPVRRKGLG